MTEENLRVVFDAISDCVVATDAAGSILWLNPAAERLLGPPADVAGRSASSVLALHPHRTVPLAAGDIRSLAIVGSRSGSRETAHDFLNVFSVVQSYVAFILEASSDEQEGDARWAAVRRDAAALDEAVAEGLELCRLLADGAIR